jgi:hypothetical protein
MGKNRGLKPMRKGFDGLDGLKGPKFFEIFCCQFFSSGAQKEKGQA